MEALRHLKRLEHAVLIAITGRLFLILGFFGALSRQLVGGEGLELDCIGTAFRGGLTSAIGHFLVAVMIDASLGDDESLHGDLP